MHTLRRGLTGVTLLLSLTVLGALVALPVLVAPAAHASNPATGQKLASGRVSIASSTPAVIVTGTASMKIVVTGMRLATETTGGPVTFYDGAATTTALLTAYCPVSTTANNNVEVSPTFLGDAWPTIAGGAGSAGTGYGTAGNSLCAQLNGCVLDYEITYYLK